LERPIKAKSGKYHLKTIGKVVTHTHESLSPCKPKTTQDTSSYGQHKISFRKCKIQVPLLSMEGFLGNKIFLECVLFANMPIWSVAPSKANKTKLRGEIPSSNYLVIK
jgi:hypothetical protein